MSSPLKTRLQADLNEARKARDKLRTLVLSTTLSELRNLEIEMGKEAEDPEVRHGPRQGGEAPEGGCRADAVRG